MTHTCSIGKECIKCPDVTAEDLLKYQIAYCVSFFFLMSFLWIALSWTPVFGSTTKEFTMKWCGWPIRMFHKWKTGFLKIVPEDGIEQGHDIVNFLANPKNVKLFQQYLKILIGYLQVVGSFIFFKVKVPDVLGTIIQFVHNICSFFSLDML